MATTARSRLRPPDPAIALNRRPYGRNPQGHLFVLENSISPCFHGSQGYRMSHFSKFEGVPLNEFQRRKWKLALSVLIAGMVAALLWHGYQGWGLHRGYPYNTFLFLPSGRFSDLMAVAASARLPDPYSDPGSVYFPFTYLVFQPLAHLRPDRAAYLCCGAGIFLLLILMTAVFRPWMRRAGEPSFTGTLRAFALAVLFLAVLYPLWFCLDRANIEIVLAPLVAASLYFLIRRRWPESAACLIPAICFKLYPIVLLPLYLRPGKLRWIGITLAAVLLLSWGSLAGFQGPCLTTGKELQANLAAFKSNAILNDLGFNGSATPWNAYKAFLGSLPLRPSAPAPWTWKHPHHLRLHLRIYSLVTLAVAATLAFHVCFVETELLRRAVLLLLLMVMASPIGGDYKLLHLATALVIWLAVATRRRHDLSATLLLAFALIPKKEILLPFLGPTDSNLDDVSIGIILTPLALLLTVVLLVWDGYVGQSRKWTRQRLRNLLPFLTPRSNARTASATSSSPSIPPATD